MIDLGYESYNTIVNLGTLSFLVVFYFIKIVYFILLQIITKPKCSKTNTIPVTCEGG